MEPPASADITGWRFRQRTGAHEAHTSFWRQPARLPIPKTSNTGQILVKPTWRRLSNRARAVELPRQNEYDAAGDAMAVPVSESASHRSVAA